MKTAIYIRVSTQEQAQEGYSIAAQEDRLRAYCTAKGWPVLGVYTDAGYSGSNTQRPALERMLADVDAGLVDCVLVYKLDRLSRSQKDTLMLIEDRFLAAGVAFVSISENFDTSTPLGRAMVGILSVFAQLEREQIKERMALGREERAKNGLFHGGGWSPFGYRYIDGRLVTEPIEAVIVREAYELFLHRQPIHAIALFLSEKYGREINPGQVHSILTSPIYAGVIMYHGNAYPGQHEAFISKETWEKASILVNDRRRLAASKADPFRAKYIFTGILVCANCGATYMAKGNYSGHKPNLKYRPYYTCWSRSRTVPKKVIDPSCRNPAYPVQELDPVLLGEILKLADDEDAFRAVVEKNRKKKKTDDRSKERAAASKRLDAIDVQIRRVLDLYQLGSIDSEEIKKRVSALEKERDALRATLDEEKKADVVKLKPREARSFLAELKSISGSGDVDAIRSVLLELIVRIEALPTKGEFNIIWNF